MRRKAEHNSTEETRATRVGEILKAKFESHKIGYAPPAAARVTQLIRSGWTVIAENISLEAAKKQPVGSVWLVTGEVLAPPAKQQKDAA